MSARHWAAPYCDTCGPADRIPLCNNSITLPMPPRLITDWIVDYGQGPRSVSIPHAWRQEVDVRWEGPAIYRTTLEVPDRPCWLVFHGVSYAAKVFVNDELVAEHCGIWDAFSVPLLAFRLSPLALRVEVTKNGGATYPVRDVASGFLPFVFNTFGGIYKEVELVESEEDPMLEIWGMGGNAPERTERSRAEMRTERPRSLQATSPSPSPHPVLPSSLHATPGSSASQPPPPIASRQGEGVPECRVTVKGTKIFVDGKPFYLRAPLTWGWYPEFGHTNPDEETVRKEVRQMKSMGFNTCKFCLWVPHHRYFEILEEEGMFAWLELPLWDPTPDLEKQDAMFQELRRIVLEYRRHSNIIVWTCGCELSSNTSAEYRERLYEMVKELTGAALVKDNSGGSEMYGGDLREFGDFYDFHPYCDLPFYPLVLDSLMVGPRKKMPILLGEFNDYDVHRDLARLKRERPFWASSDPYLNDQGSRWDKPELPRIIDKSRFALHPRKNQSPWMQQSSFFKAHFMRKVVQESVESHDDIAGYVITGWRDTPIASSGFVDDWKRPRGQWEANTLNEERKHFLIAFRRPPWLNGGNRPGWIDTFNFFAGPVAFRIGVRSKRTSKRDLFWEISQRGQTVAYGTTEAHLAANHPTAIADIYWIASEPGNYGLLVQNGRFKSSWIINVFGQPQFSRCDGWRTEDPLGLLAGVGLPGGGHVVATGDSAALKASLEQGMRCVWLLHDVASRTSPFWREAALEFYEESPATQWLSYNWEALLAISPDRVIDIEALLQAVGKLEDLEVLINRIDTRTYREDPILIRARVGKGTLVATTLRPYGGLGIQPVGVMNNPAGAALLESLVKLAEEK